MWGQGGKPNSCLGNNVLRCSGGEDLALCVENVKQELRTQSHPPSLTSNPAVLKPDVLIKMPLKETNQLPAPVHDDLFYLTHGRLLMSTM